MGDRERQKIENCQRTSPQNQRYDGHPHLRTESHLRVVAGLLTEVGLGYSRVVLLFTTREVRSLKSGSFIYTATNKRRVNRLCLAFKSRSGY